MQMPIALDYHRFRTGQLANNFLPCFALTVETVVVRIRDFLFFPLEMGQKPLRRTMSVTELFCGKLEFWPLDLGVRRTFEADCDLLPRRSAA